MDKPVFDASTCERIARKYCELMGLDPDEQVGIEAIPFGGPAPDVLLPPWPRWKVIAAQVPSQIAWLTAIEECA